MGRRSKNAVIIDGKPIGFSLKDRRPKEPFWFVVFRGKDGRRLERSTKCTAVSEAMRAAEGIIQEEYKTAEAFTHFVRWDEVVGLLKKAFSAHNLRPKTVEDYMGTLNVFREVYSGSLGPEDITIGLAKGFKTARSGQVKPKTVAANIKKLSALWQKWFLDELGVVTSNPWTEVEPPKVDKKEPRVLSIEEEKHFLDWIRDRFGGWELPVLFYRTKGACGCRILELASLKSTQLRDGRIWFHAEDTKGRESRGCWIPENLYQDLQRVRGSTWLWESYTVGLLTFLRSQGYQKTRFRPNDEFVPQRLVHRMQHAVIEYNKKMKEEVPGWRPFTSHNFRGTAMSRYIELSGGDFQGASIAMDCGVETIKSNYANIDRQKIADGVFKRMAKGNKPPESSQGV